VISVPQLLSARQVPEATIAAMTAVMISPGFWTFLVCPVLDVRFSRRWYAVVTAVIAAALLALALLSLEHPAWVEALLVVGFFFANLYQSALGGWLASITTAEEKNTLSVWVTIANISGGGAMAMIAGEVVQRLAPTVAAFLLGAAVLLPIAIFPWMQAPGPDRRLARESFSQFLGEVLKVLKRREVLIAIVLFIAPAATFSLTNYLAIGVAGAIFTLGLILLPHTPATFALALIGENVFQAVAITASTAIAFETIGASNPLASTNYCLMISAFNIANTYMLVVDGWGYSWRGVAGGYAADAALSLAASLLLAALLTCLSRRRKAASQRRAVFSS
jgi:PAT family beta-lactamase induction signal transducer AmpG